MTGLKLDLPLFQYSQDESAINEHQVLDDGRQVVMFIIHSFSSKINQESTDATDDLQFSLYIWWQEERCQVSSQTEEVDDDWFPDPVFIKSRMQTGKSIIQMRDKETTTAAYLGLEVKYPKIEMKIIFFLNHHHIHLIITNKYISPDNFVFYYLKDGNIEIPNCQIPKYPNIKHENRVFYNFVWWDFRSYRGFEFS